MAKNIILLSGGAGSGKDTVGKYVIGKYGYTRLSFADKLKSMVSVLFGFDRDVLDGLTPEHRDLRELPDDIWSILLDTPITMRGVLEDFAHIMRQHFSKDIFALTVVREIVRHNYKSIVITDNRFINEIEVLEKWLPEYNIVSVNVVRNLPSWYSHFIEHVNCECNDYNTWQQHLQIFLQNNGYTVRESEFSLVGYGFDKVLTNRATLEELYFQIDKLMKELK